MSEMNSFEDAFYIIAKELGFDYAQPLSPREVFDQQMLPRIKELVASHAEQRDSAQAQTEQQEAHDGEFQREDRYIVIKRKDLDALSSAPGETHYYTISKLMVLLDMLVKHLPKRECLVIESDWPEYEPAWAAIQARVTGEN